MSSAVLRLGLRNVLVVCQVCWLWGSSPKSSGAACEHREAALAEAAGCHVAEAGVATCDEHGPAPPRVCAQRAPRGCDGDQPCPEGNESKRKRTPEEKEARRKKKAAKAAKLAAKEAAGKVA